MGKGNFGGVGMSEYITLYPSNWLYNAGVIGLMHVFHLTNADIEKWFQDDGSVKIKKDIFEKINVDQLYFGEKKISSIIGKAQIYRNYLQIGWKDTFKFFVNNLKELQEVNDCGICSNGFYLPDGVINSCKHKENLEKFLQGIRMLDVRLNNFLAPSKKFPNTFWNCSSSLRVCDLCGYILIHHHIALTNLSDNSEIFINAPSFKVMWYLNKFAEQILSKNKSYQIREILGISFMEFAQKVFVTLGAWSIMNIEMVIKKVDKIDYYSLPYEISRVLLQKEIASLINATKEPLILEIILNGKFSYLLNLSHKILRYLIAETSAFNDKYLSPLRNKDVYSLKNLSKILPELYTRINSIISREVII